MSKYIGGPMIERFILETAIVHRNIGLKALQLFQSFSEDNGAAYQENAMGFYDEMEQSLVNGELPKKHRLQAREDGDYEDKRYKADYLRL